MNLPTKQTSQTIRKLKTLIKQNNPIQVSFGKKGFDPNEITGRTFLITISGNSNDARTQEVKEEGDDMALEIEGNKHCAITSKPLIIGGNRFYFTRDGFVGTMALHKHTLLSGDVYKPSKGKTEIDLEDYSESDINDLDLPDDAKIKETKGGVKRIEFDDEEIKSDDGFEGDIISLHGSKKTLYKMNKAKRLRKLLTPQGVSKDRMLAYIGSGAAIGFVISNWLANQ